tara:strand:+ start:9017 stop:9988 length:972 start_codon:yes stop_codon:yes gene_type:complete
MKTSTESFEILHPKKQLSLFGYDNYFNSLINLFIKNKLPNTILFSGQKGSGKATFAYHLINYLLSYNEENKYSIENFTINPENKSYKNLCDDIHPNFFLLENKENVENIKIDDVRNIQKFLNKSTYKSNIKIVLIDNAEYLNINSSNALLKALEEPNNNTFFFIINNNSKKILNTIKSRCIEFRFFFNQNEKKMIFNNLVNQFENKFNINMVDDDFYTESAGNILKYMKILNENNINHTKDKISCISYLLDQYKLKKDSQLLIFISFLIELFYKNISSINNKKSNIYFYNKFKILNQINNMKKFNLDKNNLFISIQGILKNET